MQGAALSSVDAAEVDADTFHADYVLTGRPCVLLGTQRGWKAERAWQPGALVERCCTASEHCRADTRSECHWRIGDDPQHTVDLRDYVLACEDGDAPDECIFDSTWPQRLSADYTPPAALAHDLFSLTDGAPPHAWMIIGGRGSGTRLHTDPLATCAWNALVLGVKRWAFFPPRAVAATEAEAEAEAQLDASAALRPRDWFLSFLPRALSSTWAGPRPLLHDQCATETVFVPEGWRHVVLNAAPLCLAVTHNVAAPSSLPRLLPLAAECAPRWTTRLCEQLRVPTPSLGPARHAPRAADGSGAGPEVDTAAAEARA